MELLANSLLFQFYLNNSEKGCHTKYPVSQSLSTLAILDIHYDIANKVLIYFF